MICIEGLTKRYGNLVAVSDLSLTAKPGEIYGFLGPNGAGKTTTMKITVGLLQASGGRVMVCGHDIERDSLAARRCLGWIPDTPHPYERLTGREFLLTIGALYGLRGAERERCMREGLGLFDLDPWADELAESYSHGMKQKLMIAAALQHNPQVLIADEPLVGLDPKSARRLKELFRRLATEGKTILLSTHILEIAERICDRVGIINRGKLVAEGTVDQLREASKSPDKDLESLFLTLTAPDEDDPAKAL